MLQILYTSRLTHGTGKADIADILRCARRNNAELGIGGILTIDGPKVLQILEGPPAFVTALLDLLQTDRRHRGVTVHLRRTERPPQFHRWRMAYAAIPHLRSTIEDPNQLIDDLADWLERQPREENCPGVAMPPQRAALA